MAYVITGATGHIGNNLARSLIQNHKEVVILTRRMDRAIEGLHAKFIVGDIFDDSFLDNHIRENDIVIHLAGVIDIKNNKMDETYKINYELTKKLVDICMNKNIERFIYFSSVDCIYKKNDEKVVEPEEIFADKFSDNYSHTKALATSYVLKMRRLYPNIKINILYPLINLTFLSKVMIRFITVPFRPGTITYSMNKSGINGAIQSTPVISCIFLFFPAGQNLSNCFHAIWSKRKTLYKQILPAFSFENMYSLAKLW